MINLSVQLDDQTPIEVQLDRVSRPDLIPLAKAIATTVEDGNRAGLLASTDAHGNDMADLAESTLDDPRRGGDGPPMIPRSAASSMIGGFDIEINRVGNAVEVLATWPDIAKYHRERSRTGRPARDVVGVRPKDRATIVGHVLASAQELMRF